MKSIREELCMSRAELAKELNVTENAVRLWERGITQPRYASMRSIKAFCIRKKVKPPEMTKDK